MGTLNRFFLLHFLSIVALGFTTKMNVMYKWKFIDYVWSSQEAKEKALRSGKYNYSSPILIDLDRSQDGRVFVTLAKTRGVPASLGVVSYKKGPGGPLIKPYPNWSWHEQGDCMKSIINVYRIAIDSCNRLWVLDNGMIDDKQVCHEKLLVFDLSSNQIIMLIPIHEKYSKKLEGKKSLLMTPIIRTKKKDCKKEKVFITDVAGYGLLVWNHHDKLPLELPSYFGLDSLFNEVNFKNPKGTSPFTKDRIGLALSPKSAKNREHLFLRPHASNCLYVVNITNIEQKNWNFQLHLYGCDNKLSSASTAQAFSSQSTLFFGLTEHSAIGCLNMHRNFETENIEIVAQNDKTLQFVSGMKVIPPTQFYFDEELWVSTNLNQNIADDVVKLNKVNFRILKQSVKKLIKGTKCDVPIDIR